MKPTNQNHTIFLSTDKLIRIVRKSEPQSFYGTMVTTVQPGRRSVSSTSMSLRAGLEMREQSSSTAPRGIGGMIGDCAVVANAFHDGSPRWCPLCARDGSS
jgi:hypothetical protein